MKLQNRLGAAIKAQECIQVHWDSRYSGTHTTRDVRSRWLTVNLERRQRTAHTQI